jgi:glucose-1-phosphate adenylyltransferase
MAKVLGLVNLHTSPDLGAITKNRSFAALTFLGRYSFVDIPLSNFTNSSIDTVGILVSRSPKSMIKHMDNAMSYTNNTKLGKTIICYNEQYANNPLYNTDINNIIENKWLIEERNFKYVVIAPAHILYTMDYNKLIAKHQMNKSEISVLYSKIETGKTNCIDQDILDIAPDGRLNQITKNLGIEDEVNLSLETYIINIDTLMNLLRFASETSKFFTIRDVLNYICSTKRIDTISYRGLFAHISNLDTYMEASLKFLDEGVRKTFFKEDWPIYTKTHDTPPTRYLDEASVSNSFVSNGAIINGKIENSIICREVNVQKGAFIKNSIILSDAEISQNAHLEYVIVDKGAKILHVKELKGTKENPLYVGMGDVI